LKIFVCFKCKILNVIRSVSFYDKLRSAQKHFVWTAAFATSAAAIIMLSVAACGRQISAVAVGDACQKAAGSVVTVEGFLRLPMSTDSPARTSDSRNEQMLIIVEKINGTGNFLTAAVRTSDSSERNHITTLPLSYTYADLQIITVSGSRVTADDKVRISGRIARDARECVLEVETIRSQ